MTSSIEKAAQRLEQLRSAGVVLPEMGSEPPPHAAGDSPLTAGSPISKVVQVDVGALAAAGFITPQASRSAITDQFRIIKRPVLENALGKNSALIANGNLVMVTSALPGEGKSFTAINLAMSIAMEVGCSVMLVDADVARPTIMKKLGLVPGPGLLDLLLNPKLELSDVLLRTNIENLTILQTGLPHPNATELLAGAAMAELLNDIAKRYNDRVVIFDSPPLLLTTEAPVLAAHMGQVLIVVQAEKTLQSQIQQALATIDKCPVKLMVLNQARNRAHEHYGYGYGYVSSGGHLAASAA
jgi:exopolysaccharide/PEP-CTERM locus tyrosine autokinase